MDLNVDGDDNAAGVEDCGNPNSEIHNSSSNVSDSQRKKSNLDTTVRIEDEVFASPKSLIQKSNFPQKPMEGDHTSQ